MSDFDPGPGWLEIEVGTFPQSGEAFVHWAAGPAGPFRDWVREEPVPPLPTEPYTVICGKWAGGDAVIVQTDDGWRFPAVAGEPLVDNLLGFEVLAEPRAVTAKAVLNRLPLRGATRGQLVEWVKSMANEFGVSDAD